MESSSSSSNGNNSASQKSTNYEMGEDYNADLEEDEQDSNEELDITYQKCIGNGWCYRAAKCEKWLYPLTPCPHDCKLIPCPDCNRPCPAWYLRKHYDTCFSCHRKKYPQAHTFEEQKAELRKLKKDFGALRGPDANGYYS